MVFMSLDKIEKPQHSEDFHARQPVKKGQITLVQIDPDVLQLPGGRKSLIGLDEGVGDDRAEVWKRDGEAHQQREGRHEVNLPENANMLQ